MNLDRRRFLAAAGGAALAGLSGCGGAPARKTNLVVILADDMGYSDIGCYGGEIETPNLDRLAAEGLRFSRFYNAARCCPTRAALLTGLYPHQAGVGHMVNDRGRPAYQGYLNDRCATIAEALKPSGYATLFSGKWHVGEERPHWPVDRGFDRSFGLISGASNYFKLDSARKMTLDGEPWRPPEDGSFYMTDAIGDHAVRFLRESVVDSQPFFLYLPFTAPHWPLHAKPEHIEKYRGRYAAGWDRLREERFERLQEIGLVDAEARLSPRDDESPPWADAADKPRWERRMEVYAAMVDSMDQNIGKVLDQIRAMGRDEDTLVMFLADNGGSHESADIERGTGRNTWGDPEAMPGPADSFDGYDLPWANASNTPFRRFKSWVHEGGVATPLICRWPAGIGRPAGSISDEVGHVIDLAPTCLDVAGASYPADKTPLEGKSLRPIFETGSRPGHETLFWEHQGNRAVRRGDWKLVSRYDPARDQEGPWELYDLARDRTELNDLASSEPERVAELTAAYDAWAARVGAVPPRELS